MAIQGNTDWFQRLPDEKPDGNEWKSGGSDGRTLEGKKEQSGEWRGRRNKVEESKDEKRQQSGEYIQ